MEGKSGLTVFRIGEGEGIQEAREDCAPSVAVLVKVIRGHRAEVKGMWPPLRAAEKSRFQCATIQGLSRSWSFSNSKEKLLESTRVVVTKACSVSVSSPVGATWRLTGRTGRCSVHGTRGPLPSPLSR